MLFKSNFRHYIAVPGFTAAMSSGGQAGLVPLLVAVGVTGVADALAQGSLFGVAGPMPEQYTQALMVRAGAG